jgi:PAS domain S-box-containing protein
MTMPDEDPTADPVQDPLAPLRAIEHKLIDPEFLTDVLDLLRRAVIIADATGTIVLTNTAAEMLFGYTGEELYGQSVECLLPARLRELHRVHRYNYDHQPRLHRRTGLELVGLRKDGTEIPIEIDLGPLIRKDVSMTVALISLRQE